MRLLRGNRTGGVHGLSEMQCREFTYRYEATYNVTACCFIRRRIMVDFRTLEIGEKLLFYSSEFDGEMQFDGTVSFANEDHAILTDGEGFDWWIDDDTADQFYQTGEKPRMRDLLFQSRQTERCCRVQPAPFTLYGEQSSYNFFVERFYPGERGKATLGPVIYIGSNAQVQEFANILNYERSEYRNSLLECTEMRKSLGIRLMEGADFYKENIAAEHPYLLEKTVQRTVLLKTEMSRLHYFYDESASDPSLSGEKVYISGMNYQKLRFGSDAETLGWLKNNPDISLKHRRELYEQTRPERMELELRRIKGAQLNAQEERKNSQDTAIAVQVPDTEYAAVLPSGVPRGAARRNR